eukprot:scaffold36581_cov72-Phaeocystis_antarctica.AAC.2
MSRLSTPRRPATTVTAGAQSVARASEATAQPKFSEQRDVDLARELGAVVLRARDGERGVQRQLERADGEEPEGQRADDTGLQREGDERRDAEGLVAHGVEVGAVLAAVHQVFLAVDAWPVHTHVGRLAQRAGDGTIEAVEHIVEDGERRGGEVPPVDGEQYEGQRARHAHPGHVVGQHRTREEGERGHLLEPLA